MRYLGDFAEDETLVIWFTTNEASGGRANPSDVFEVGDFRIYKDTSNTGRSSQAGFAIATTMDSLAGVHRFSVDLSDNTDAGFYAAGSEYSVVLYPDETIDGESISVVLAQFSIFNRPVNVSSWRGTAVAEPTVAGVPKVDLTHINGAITDGSVAAASRPILSLQQLKMNCSIADEGALNCVNNDALGYGQQNSGLTAGIINYSASGIAMYCLGSTGDITGDLSGSVGSVTGAVGSVIGAVGSVTGHTNQTGDSFARIGAAGASLSDLGGMSTTMKGQVNTEVDGALNTAVPGSPVSNSINERIVAMDALTEASGGGDLAAIKTSADRLTAVRAAVLTDLIDGGRLDLLIDAILLDTGTNGVVLADGAITAAKIATDAITAAKIATDAIGSLELAAGAAAEIAALITPYVDEVESLLKNSTYGLSALKTAVDGVTTVGTGSVSTSIECKAGGVVIDGVEVWITSDEAGVSVVAGTVVSDANGLAAFLLDAGTYYVWRQLAGYNFDNPRTITVS